MSKLETHFTSLLFRSTICTLPWRVKGDFNVITFMGEKIEGIPYRINKSIDFLNMIEDCGMVDLGFYGP